MERERARERVGGEGERRRGKALMEGGGGGQRRGGGRALMEGVVVEGQRREEGRALMKGWWRGSSRTSKVQGKGEKGRGKKRGEEEGERW